MKTKLLLSTSLFLFTASLFAQTSGGPDTYGYTWKNNAAVGGPVYNWKNIKGIGTQIIGLTDDDQKGPIDMNWNFHYYWSDYNKIWMGSNGWVAFQDIGNIAAVFPTIPIAAAPNNYIAPMMCDLTFTQSNSSAVPGATAWYWTNNVDTTIVQYDSVPYWVGPPNAPLNPGHSGRYTFQVILSGADSSITYQYKLTQAGTSAYAMANEGLTTGIENSTGQIGLQVLTNVFPAANTAVKFYYPSSVTYQAFDAAPTWNHSAGNGGFFVSSASTPMQLKTNIENVGNQNISAIPVNGELFDVNINPVWNSTYTVTALAAGADTILTYPTAYTPTASGTFMFRTSTALSNDMNTANDITDVEMVVVDTTQANISLGYTTQTSTSTASAWGGNGGQGIYIEPPFYPATITSLDFFVLQSGSVGNHLARIVDDNGPGNTPGTLLYEVSVPANTAIPGAYNNVPVTTPIVVTSGGIYIAWMENGDSLSAIGTEQIIPFSKRNYEILANSWAVYRNNSTEDLMIRANMNAFGAITTSTTPDGCPSNNTGTATVNISGGVAPITYSWSTTPVQTTATATGLSANTYTTTVTDAHGSTATTSVFVGNAVTTSITSSTQVTCYGGSNGAATVSSTGTSPFTYAWSPGGQTTATVTGLSAGVYSVVVTDGAGCFNMSNVTITSPTALVINTSTNNATCVNNNGTAVTSVSGGTPAYTYSWNTSPVQTTANANGLGAGNYTLTVTDAVGCTSTSAVTITKIPMTSTTSVTPTSCFAGTNGTATVVTVSGGIAPYTYAWPTSPVQTTATATGLSAGSYTVITSDSQGCTSSAVVTITSPTAVNPNATSNPASCPTCTNGTASVTTNGGTPPYTYSWNTVPVKTTATITGLTPGNYSVCVTDSKGCTKCDSTNVMISGISELYNGASIVISPNPFNSTAQVKIDLLEPVHHELLFTIYDVFGKKVESIDLSAMKGGIIDFTLNRSHNIPNGIYFYRLEDDQQILSTGKIIVQ